MGNTALIDVAASNDDELTMVRSPQAAPSSTLARQPTPLEQTPNEYEENDNPRAMSRCAVDVDEDDETLSGNVVEFPSRTDSGTKKAKDYSDWVTVEKRRSSQNVIAHYVRYKDANGKKRVGHTDYMTVADFKKRFSRRKRHYAAYKEQLIAIHKATTIRAGKGTFPSAGRVV